MAFFCTFSHLKKKNEEADRGEKICTSRRWHSDNDRTKKNEGRWTNF